jgi:hypothetical protein
MVMLSLLPGIQDKTWLGISLIALYERLSLLSEALSGHISGNRESVKG